MIEDSNEYGRFYVCTWCAEIVRCDICGEEGPGERLTKGECVECHNSCCDCGAVVGRENLSEGECSDCAALVLRDGAHRYKEIKK